MPNHVRNMITFQGDPERIREMLTQIQDDEEGFGSIDFNKLIPMPQELGIESGSRTNEGLKFYNASASARFDRRILTADSPAPNR